MNTTILFFAANILFCVAYIIRDILWLRVITILACFCTFPYFLLRETPLYSATFWQSAFILINAVNLTLLILERRPVKLTPDQLRLHTLVFRMLTPRELLKFMSIAKWTKADPGDMIVKKGEHMDSLLLVFEGNANVVVEDSTVANLKAGGFIGEMSYMLGGATSADVVAGENLRYLAWDRSDLSYFFQKNPALEKVLNVILGKDMALKLTK